MFEGFYRNRLASDLPQWQAQGWITPEGANAILNNLPVRSRISLSGVIAVLGALLLGAGVLAFVGANWEGMPPIVRFILLVAVLGVTYGFAAVLRTRGHDYYSEAMLLLAGMIFAGAIALVGQAYHLTGEFRDAVLFWTIGCLIAAVLTRSVAMTVLALVGTVLWAKYIAIDLEHAPHWPSLALLLITGAVVLWLDSNVARRAFILALLYWIGMTMIMIADLAWWPYIGVLSLCAGIGLFLWGFATIASTDWLGASMGRLGRDMVWPALIGIMVALFFIQILFEDTHHRGTGWITPTLAFAIVGAGLAVLASLRGSLNMAHAAVGLVIVLAVTGFAQWQISAPSHADVLWPRLMIGALILASALWLISLAHTVTGHDLHTIGLAAFGLEILYIYTVTLGTLIDTALAFFVGGGLLIALSFLLFKVDRWLKARNRSEFA